MDKKSASPKIDPVEMVVQGWDASWNYTASSYHKKWQDMTDLYNSKRIYVGYNGISDTFVPMSFSTVETMVSATAGEKPLVQYVQTKPEQATNTEVLNGLYSYYWDLDNWTNKKVMSSRQFFKLGTTVEFYYWDIDHPVMKLIPLRDFFCDPAATILGYQNSRYMGYRFLADKETLKKEMIVDPEKGELVPKYKNLDKLGARTGSGDQTDKEQKDTQMGSTLEGDESGNQIEVICYWTLDDVYYVGNREQVIYHAPNPFKIRQQFLGWENPTGMYPFVIDSFLPDESLLYGTSVLDSIAKPQELLNDITNQNVDAVAWSLDPVMELDPMYASYIDKIKNVTGAVYPFKPGSYSAVQKPQIPNNAFNERSNIKNEIRETTAVDEIIKGISTPSRTTATEVKAQVASAGRRFDLIVSQLENGGYYQQAKLVFQLVRMYVTAPTMYRIIGKDGVDWDLFDPEMFEGDYEPRVKLKTTLDDEKNKKMRDLKELYTAMLGNPLVDQAQLTRMVFKYGFDLEPDEVDPLMVDPKEISPPEDDKKETPEEIALKGIAKGYANALPDVKAQLEDLAGLETSATHEGEMEKLAAQQMMEETQGIQTILPQEGSPAGVAPTAPPLPPNTGTPVGGQGGLE